MVGLWFLDLIRRILYTLKNTVSKCMYLPISATAVSSQVIRLSTEIGHMEDSTLYKSLYLKGPPQPCVSLSWDVSCLLLGLDRANGMTAVSSTHGNSYGQRTIFPSFSCAGNTCTIIAPPNAHVCPYVPPSLNQNIANDVTDLVGINCSYWMDQHLLTLNGSVSEAIHPTLEIGRISLRLLYLALEVSNHIHTKITLVFLSFRIYFFLIAFGLDGPCTLW